MSKVSKLKSKSFYDENIDFYNELEKIIDDVIIEYL